MENVNDWLYWVIIIIAGISSIVSSISKKIKQSGENRQPREVITEEWVDWEDNAETPHPAVPEKRPVAVPDLQAQRKASFDYGKFGSKTKPNSDYSIFKKESAPATTLYTEDNIVPVSIDDTPSNTEDWRKAFLYSEIFKRKY
ncbi:MAG: hypothetical protein LBK58_09345 [Prevotellaceae bacterium]|jgi:hypothetical protein|nr:hypothetical protein [Prevotellaceae bacterium]